MRADCPAYGKRLPASAVFRRASPAARLRPYRRAIAAIILSMRLRARLSLSAFRQGICP